MSAQVLRAKYFPNGDLLATAPTSGMSYVWRSILKGLQVFKEGMIWRVGDGRNIRIWDDPWFRSGVTRQPTTHKGESELIFVSELIDTETCIWNQNLIEQHFLPDDVTTILSIPLRDQDEDLVAWHFDSKGLFSVKSAYKVHVQMMKRNSTQQEGQGSEGESLKHQVFKKLWEVQCPPKVKHFLWRLAHNSHPLHMNIARRGVELDTRCAVCHKYFEDGGHLFLTCKFAKQRWQCLLLEDVRLKLLPCRSSIEVLEVLDLPKEEKSLTIAFLWSVWSERNSGNHGEQYICQSSSFSSLSGDMLMNGINFCPKNIMKWLHLNANGKSHLMMLSK
jgi:hypothetical protein